MNTGRNSKQTTCLCRDTGGKGTLPTQRTGFNTLDNWGHKTPTLSKRIKDRKVKLKGHGPEHVYSTLGYISTNKQLINEVSQSSYKRAETLELNSLHGHTCIQQSKFEINM